MKNLISTLRDTKVVPVIAIQDVDDALPLAEALLEGGSNVAEITLRTEAALTAVKRIKSALPKMVVGTGTVITPDQIDQSLDAGADFIVTPGTTPTLAEHLISEGAAAIPGVSTTSEVVAMLEYGFDFLKFFPAEANGGVKTLKSFAGPLAQVSFMPTGGIKESAVRSYLDLPNVVAVGGSWITDKASLAAKDWTAITANAKRCALL